MLNQSSLGMRNVCGVFALLIFKKCLYSLVTKGCGYFFSPPFSFLFSEHFHSSMSHLLTFWRNHTKCSQHSHPVAHHCEWLSLVFIEQDDDMWEAAKALLLIYLKIDRLVCILFDRTMNNNLMRLLWHT